ncbi:hypothetical protein HDU93_003167, partial [Gonapodya sp. JEL0774]
NTTVISSDDEGTDDDEATVMVGCTYDVDQGFVGGHGDDETTFVDRGTAGGVNGQRCDANDTVEVASSRADNDDDVHADDDDDDVNVVCDEVEQGAAGGVNGQRCDANESVEVASGRADNDDDVVVEQGIVDGTRSNLDRHEGHVREMVQEAGRKTVYEDADDVVEEDSGGRMVDNDVDNVQNGEDLGEVSDDDEGSTIRDCVLEIRVCEKENTRLTSEIAKLEENGTDLMNSSDACDEKERVVRQRIEALQEELQRILDNKTKIDQDRNTIEAKVKAKRDRVDWNVEHLRQLKAKAKTITTQHVRTLAADIEEEVTQRMEVREWK